MALFRLISNGQSTYLELDGKYINGECIDAVSFSHENTDGGKSVKLHLDIDLVKANEASQRAEGGIIVDDDMFDWVQSRCIKSQKMLCEMHSMNKPTREKLRQAFQDAEQHTR